MIGDFVLALFLVGGGLLALYLKSVRKDREEEQQKAARAQQEQAAAQEENRKYRKGVRLICLGCETRFLGPLTEDGCPQCHLLSLVVTEGSASQPKAKKNEA